MSINIKNEYYSMIKNKITYFSFNSALGNIDKLLANFPDDSNGYYYKGVCNFALKKYDEAIVAYQDAISKDVTYAKAYFNLGVAYYVKNEYDNALINIGKALVIFSKNRELDCRTRCIEALNLIQSERKTFD